MSLTAWERMSLDHPASTSREPNAPELPLSAHEAVQGAICDTLRGLGRVHPELDFLSLIALVSPRGASDDDEFLRAARAMLRGS